MFNLRKLILDDQDGTIDERNRVKRDWMIFYARNYSNEISILLKDLVDS